MEGYAGTQFVGIDLHRRRSVVVRMDDAGRCWRPPESSTMSTGWPMS